MRDRDEMLTTPEADTAFGLSQHTTDGVARAQVLQLLRDQDAAVTSVIEYHSDGRLVIVGSLAQALPVAQQLLDKLTSIAIIDAQPGNPGTTIDDRIRYIPAEVVQIDGHLGEFTLLLQGQGRQQRDLRPLLGRDWTHIDMVLDLSESPFIDAQIPPPGYFAPRGDAEQLADCIASIPDMLGEFEKPRFFNYDPDICAHARNHKIACTRCIDACPTLAIRSLGEQVQVDPYLCQGGGTCAAVCPSGAIQYIYPALGHRLDTLRQMLRVYRDAQGEHPRLLLFEAAHDDVVHRQLARLEENILPLALDELGAVDLAMLLNALAYGAQQVIVLLSESTSGRVRDTLQAQHALATEFLRDLGYAGQRIVITPIEKLHAVADTQEAAISPARHGGFDDKRRMINLALAHLHQHAALQPPFLSLPATAPFGEIHVDAQLCTLCLACTGACPTGALLAGGDLPQLRFIEDHCVQCGLCEQTCPEQAIHRSQRYLFDASAREARRTLHEEPAFACVACGKPFATRRIIEQMQDRLSGHWMFGNERAMRRLQMCEDCRIEDLWDEQEQTG